MDYFLHTSIHYEQIISAHITPFRLISNSKLGKINYIQNKKSVNY